MYRKENDLHFSQNIYIMKKNDAGDVLSLDKIKSVSNIQLLIDCWW